MNARPHILLPALAVVCFAAVAWAADAPKSAPAPASHPAVAAPAAHGDDAHMLVEAGEDDLGDIDVEGGDDGARHVIVRRMVTRGPGGGPGAGCGPECGPMRGGKGHGMGPGKGECGMGGGMGQGKGGCAMGGEMGPGAGPGMLGHMFQALDLTEAQRAKLADIHERQQRRDIQARADQEIARLDLRKAMDAEKPDAGAINTQIDRVAKLRTDMAKARVAALLEARALLTPEQQKQMHEMRQAHGPGMPGMPGMGRGMGMGHGRGMGPGGQPMRVKVQVERDEPKDK
jgi:Spy/CpxP family protein refolding chaperone